MFQADLEKRARERLAEANAAIALAEARAQAEVRRTQIETENHTKQAQSRVENEILKERNATAMQVCIAHIFLCVFCTWCWTVIFSFCHIRVQYRSSKNKLSELIFVSFLSFFLFSFLVCVD